VHLLKETISPVPLRVNSLFIGYGPCLPSEPMLATNKDWPQWRFFAGLTGGDQTSFWST